MRFLPENIVFATFFNVLAQIRYSPLDQIETNGVKRRYIGTYDDIWGHMASPSPAIVAQKKAEIAIWTAHKSASYQTRNCECLNF